MRGDSAVQTAAWYIRVMTALVLGFGPFGAVTDNPSSRLALALDGRAVGAGHALVGRIMPVSYQRSFEVTMVAVAAVRPAFVLGVGVAMTRSASLVERFARNYAHGSVPDVDGEMRRDHGTGTLLAECAAAAELAAALGFGVSEDAGEYVCNAWLFQALRARLPCAFLHVPEAGADPDQVASGLGRFLAG